MSSFQTQQSGSQAGHGLAPGARRWSVGVVLLVALALALAVPLAGRALGADSAGKFPGCAIAPWTGTCSCMLARDGTAMSYADFASELRQPAMARLGIDRERVLADARRACRIDHMSGSPAAK